MLQEHSILFDSSSFGNHNFGKEESEKMLKTIEEEAEGEDEPTRKTSERE